MPFNTDDVARPNRVASFAKHALAIPTAMAMAAGGVGGLLYGGGNQIAGMARWAAGDPNVDLQELSAESRRKESAPASWVKENMAFGEEAEDILSPITSIFEYVNKGGEAAGQATFDYINGTRFKAAAPLAAAAVESGIKILPYLGLERAGMKGARGTRDMMSIKGSDFVPTSKEFAKSLATPANKRQIRYVNDTEAASNFDVSGMNPRDQVNMATEVLEPLPAVQLDSTPTPFRDGFLPKHKVEEGMRNEKELGLRYEGEQDLGNGTTWPMYTDLETKSTFMVKPTESVAEAKQRILDNYAAHKQTALDRAKQEAENRKKGWLNGTVSEKVAMPKNSEGYFDETAGWSKESSATPPKPAENPLLDDPLYGTKPDMTIGEIAKLPDDYITTEQFAAVMDGYMARGETKAAAAYHAKYAMQSAVRKTKIMAKELATRIAEPIPDTVHYTQKGIIEELRNGIEPTFLSEKKYSSMKRTEQFLKDNPDALGTMPDKVLKALRKKSINDCTLAELHAINDAIFNPERGLIKQGELKRELVLKKEAREHNATLDELNFTLSDLKDRPNSIPPKPNAPTPAQQRWQIWRDRFTSLKLSTLIPQHVFDKLDGDRNFAGKFHDIFYKRTNDAVNTEMRMSRKSVDAGNAKLKDLGLDLKHWNKQSTVEGINLSRQQMLNVYLGWKNPANRAAIMEVEGISEATAQAIIREITPQEKAFGEFILKDNAEAAPRIEAVMQKTANKNLTREPNYTTIVYEGDAFKQLSFEERVDIEQGVRDTVRRALPTRKFIQERVGLPAGTNVRLNMNVVDNWLSHVTKREHYIANMEHVQKMSRLLNDERLAQVIRDKAGQPTLNYMKEYVKDIANPTLFRQMDKASQVSRVLRRNTASAYIALNPSSILMQTASLPKYLKDAGASHLMGSLMDFCTNAPSMYKRVCEMEPQIKDRFFEREVAELGEIHKSNVGNALETLQNAGMAPTKMLDKVMIIVGYDAVYNKYKPLVGEKLAREKALEVTMRTQSATHVKDLAPLYKQNEAYNWALMFTNDLSKSWGELAHTLPADIKAGRLRDAGYTMAGFGAMALIAWTIMHKTFPQSEGDVRDAFTEQALSTIPLVGNMTMARKEGYGDASSPVMNALSVPGSWLSNKSTKAKLKDTMEATAVFTGIPYSAPRKFANAYAKDDPRLILGAERSVPSDEVVAGRYNKRGLRVGARGKRDGKKYLR